MHSPTYLAGLRDRGGTVMVDPARLAWGMAAHLRSRGVRHLRGSPVGEAQRHGAGIRLAVGTRTSDAPRTAVSPPRPTPHRSRLRAYIMPLYDHVLVTEPLSSAQLDSLGWGERQGMTDAGNQFHYYRLTADDRILWGGWDANYYRGGRVDHARAARRLARGARRALLRDLPAARRAVVHPPMGRSDRLDRAVHRGLRHRARRHGSRMRRGTPGSGSGHPGSRRMSRSTCSRASPPAARGTGSCGASRSPFRRSRSAIRSCSTPVRSTFDADNNDGRRGAWLRLLDTLRCRLQLLRTRSTGSHEQEQPAAPSSTASESLRPAARSNSSTRLPVRSRLPSPSPRRMTTHAASPPPAPRQPRGPTRPPGNARRRCSTSPTPRRGREAPHRARGHRGRQAVDHDARRRDPVRDRQPAVLRRCRTVDRRYGSRRVQRGLHLDDDPAPGRRGRGDRTVELPAHHGAVEGRAGARRRQCGGAEARAIHTRFDTAARRTRDSGGPAGGRAQRRDRRCRRRAPRSSRAPASTW